jgi:hypothetical protein
MLSMRTLVLNTFSSQYYYPTICRILKISCERTCRSGYSRTTTHLGPYTNDAIRLLCCIRLSWGITDVHSSRSDIMRGSNHSIWRNTILTIRISASISSRFDCPRHLKFGIFSFLRDLKDPAAWHINKMSKLPSINPSHTLNYFQRKL